MSVMIRKLLQQPATEVQKWSLLSLEVEAAAEVGALALLPQELKFVHLLRVASPFR